MWRGFYKMSITKTLVWTARMGFGLGGVFRTVGSSFHFSFYFSRLKIMISTSLNSMIGVFLKQLKDVGLENLRSFNNLFFMNL